MWRIRKFLHLHWSDRALLIQAFLLLSWIRLGLKFRSFKRLRQSLAQPTITPKTGFRYSVQQIVWAVNVASRYMPGGVKCLVRALTTQELLVQNGYAPELKIGVARSEQGSLEAHAWIENQGEVVIGNLPNLSHFKSF